MKKEYIVGELPEYQYFGLHKDEIPFFMGLNKRLMVSTYGEGSPEIFHYIVTLFDEHEFKLSKNPKVAMWLKALKDKITQLIVIYNSFLKKINVFNWEINQHASSENNELKIQLKDDYFIFISEAEAIILKVSSILDIAVQLFSNITGKQIDNFGKWIKVNDKKFVYDINKDLQTLTLTSATLMLNHKINNKIKHHESLNLCIFYNLNKWSICLTGKACESKILLLDKYLESNISELIAFLIKLNESIRAMSYHQ